MLVVAVLKVYYLEGLRNVCRTFNEMYIEQEVSNIYCYLILSYVM